MTERLNLQVVRMEEVKAMIQKMQELQAKYAEPQAKSAEMIAKLVPQQDKEVQVKLKSEVKLEPNSVAFVETAPMQGSLEAKSGTIMMGRFSKKADLGVLCELQENGVAIPVANPGNSEII